MAQKESTINMRMRYHEIISESSPYEMTLYHGTDKVFDKFLPFSHFGTEAQAKMRNSKRIISATVDARKLKRMRDKGQWKLDSLKRIQRQGYEGIVYLNRYEGIPLEEFEKAYKKMPIEKLNDLPDAAFKKLIPSAEDSYIIFDPSRAKINQ